MAPADRFGARYDGALSATLSGVLDRVRSGDAALPLLESDRLDGSTCLVTGANRGLGLAVARALARRGARLVLACRSGRDEAARAVRAVAGAGAEVRGVELDLADLGSVERCVEGLARTGEHLQVAILNAGVVPREARRTRDGFDESFQVNYLATSLLVRRLIDGRLLSSRHDDTGLPRVVVVSSESHRSAPAIDLARLGVFEAWGARRAVEQYGYVKLLLQTFTAELVRRTEGAVSVFSLCPGAVRTDIGREAPRLLKPALDLTMRVFFQRPERAALPVVYLACSRAIEGQTGIYLHTTRRRSPSELASDPALGARLWNATERLLATHGHPLRATDTAAAESSRGTT